MTIMNTLREKPLQGVGVALALGFGASFLVPALRRGTLKSAPSALGAIVGPMAARLAREGAERIFAFAVEQLQHREERHASAPRK